jgi:hypothetical protein
LGFTGLGGGSENNVGTNDISFAELGVSLAEDELGSLEDHDINVVAFSANRGLVNEIVFATVDNTDTRLFAVVAGANGAFSTAPYSLQIETSYPLDVGAWLAQNQIFYTAPVTDWSTTTETTVLYPPDNPYPPTRLPKTLFVTQQERMIGRYDVEGDTTNWDAVLASLTNTELIDREDIVGDIISLPISIYEDWDKDYSSIDATEKLTADIRDIIQLYLSEHESIEYVVFVGNDDIIPFGRVPDETNLGNEHQYLPGSFLKPGSPLFFSVLNSFIQTDDYYVDMAPSLRQGRSLYLPDFVVARLVENPEDIISAINAFITSDGELQPDSAMVTGFDFFVDAADEVIRHLSDADIDPINDSLVSEDWNADALRFLLLNTGFDVNNINAHYTHYAALPASAFNSGNFSDVLTSIDVNDSARPLIDHNIRSILFTIGCHAGLNVPDLAAFSSAELGLNIDPTLDFPQAFHRAIFIGSTGYGYGDDEGLGGTEHLMEIFVKKLLQEESTSAGDALRTAKLHYINGLSTVSAYEEKSSLQFTFYGLPQYSVIPPEYIPPDQFDDPDGDLLLDVDGIETTWYYDRVNTSSGTYWTADDDAQATPWRPIMPRVIIPNIQEGGEPVHGALLTGGTFTEELVNPVITLPTTEWEQNPSETQLLPPGFWPSELTTINTQETTGGDLVQTMVIIPAQFKPTGLDDKGEVIGTQRRFSSLSFALQPSSDPSYSDDWLPPEINGVDLSLSGDKVRVFVNASDLSGIKYVSVIRINGVLESFECDLTENGDWASDELSWTTDDQLIIQVVDNAGNVATYTGKGANLSLITVDAGPDQGFDPGEEIDFIPTLDFDSLVKPVFYTLDFGDGEPWASGQVPGNTFEVTHEYTARQAIAKLKVTDSDGGVGVDTVRVTERSVPTVLLVSSDNPSIVGQPVIFTAIINADTSLLPIWTPTLTGGTVTFSHDGTVFATEDVTEESEGVAIASTSIEKLDPGWHTITATYNGNVFFLEATNSIQQQVLYGWEGFIAPIDGSQYNIGRTIPVKFSLTDFSGNSVETASAEIKAQVDNGPVVSYGSAGYSGHYQYNLDTSLVVGAIPDAWLTIIVSLDDGADYTVNIILK